MHPIYGIQPTLFQSDTSWIQQGPKRTVVYVRSTLSIAEYIILQDWLFTQNYLHYWLSIST